MLQSKLKVLLWAFLALLPIPVLAVDFSNIAQQEGPQGLLNALETELQENPEHLKTPESAALLATDAATPVADLQGANLAVYREIVERIVAATPKNLRDETSKQVTAAVTQLARADSQSTWVPGESITDTMEKIRRQREAEKAVRKFSVLGYDYIVVPQIQLTEFFDNNLYAIDDERTSDFATVISPHAFIESRWDKHRLSAEAHVDAVRYQKHEKENTVDFWLSTEGGYDLSKNAQLIGGALFRGAHEDRGSPDEINGTKPTYYREARLYAGGQQKLKDWVMRAGSTFERTYFGNTQTSTGVINNEDRDRNHITYGIALEHARSKKIVPQLRLTKDIRNYDAERDDSGYARSSDGYRATIGAKVKSTPNLDAEVAIGRLVQGYDDSRFNEVDTLAMDGFVRYRFKTDTSLTGYVERSVEETTLPAASSYVYTRVGGTLQHDITPKLLASLRFSHSHSSFRDHGRIDHDYDVSTGLRQLLSRNTYIAADYRYQMRDSSSAGADYERHQVFVRFGYLF